MLRRLQGKTYSLLVDGVFAELFLTPRGIKVSTHPFVH